MSQRVLLALLVAAVFCGAAVSPSAPPRGEVLARDDIAAFGWCQHPPRVLLAPRTRRPGASGSPWFPRCVRVLSPERSSSVNAVLAGVRLLLVDARRAGCRGAVAAR
jgi:hypothetical protein